MKSREDAPDSASGFARRPSFLRTFLSVAAGIGLLIVLLGIASRPGVPPAAQMALGILGFAGYVALVGPALDRRYRLDRKWRQAPPDLEAFMGRTSPGRPRVREGSDTSEMLLAGVALAAGLALVGNVATAAEAPGAGSDSPAPAVADDVPAPAPATPSSAAATAPPPVKAPPPEPFAFADWTWLTGNPRTTSSILDTKYFTGEVRLDVNYVYDFNQPKDHTIGGSTEVGRSQEVQLQQLGVGGDFHAGNVRGRLMTQIGMYSTMTPRNDASPSRGQWGLDNAYRYISEAYGGYHIDALHGINVDAGIFMSYIGLFSYYNFDNWAYQPSYVSSNTPWYFNGVRVQLFLSDKLKIEPWLINGWQSYGMFNSNLGVGFQLLWRPTGSLSVVSNNYYGSDTLNNPDRRRLHTDNSVQVKYRDRPGSFLSKAAFTLTADAGCESGGGVSCGGSPHDPAQYFVGFMVYNRLWFANDRLAFTVGGGAINNPGRYLVLLPPINGATATTGTPYFSTNPGDGFKAFDWSAGLDWMPEQWITFRAEFCHRGSNVPYFSGAGGITPEGGNTGNPAAAVPGFTPDLRKSENRVDLALLVKF